MNADERLARIGLKIEWAKQHILNLNFQLKAFFDSNPYEIGTQRDPQTRRLIYYVAGVREVPPPISLAAGDIIHNLRGALDHLAFQLYLIGPGGQAGGAGSRIYFPIADDVAKYKAEAPRKIKGLAPAAIKAIDAIEPYKGGQTDKSDTLWRLEKMNNIDKHRLLITIGSQFRSVDVGGDLQRGLQEAIAKGPPELATTFGTVPKMDLFLQPGNRQFPLKAGDQLFMTPPDAEVDQNRQFRFEVAFGEKQIVEGQPLIETLQHMANMVDNLVISFKPLLS